MYQVYILYSPKLDQFYRDQTQDLSDRLNRHNSAQENATAPGIPWILIWYAEKPDRSSALQFERKLKNLSRIRLIQLMEKYDKHYPGRGKHPEE
ncbi:MAG: GIY-YIG nuclease family protein [Bacteroidota bacterium]